MPYISETELAELKAAAAPKLDDTYVDRHGTTWTRPTAWAYFAACRALNHHNELIREAAACIDTFKSFADRIQKVPDCMILTMGSAMAARQLTAGDMKCLVKFLNDLQAPIDATLDREHDAKMAVQGNNQDLGDKI